MVRHSGLQLSLFSPHRLEEHCRRSFVVNSSTCYRPMFHSRCMENRILWTIRGIVRGRSKIEPQMKQRERVEDQTKDELRDGTTLWHIVEGFVVAHPGITYLGRRPYSRRARARG